MKTSVIISTYNNPESLRKCLLSFLVQTRPPDQVIISDDGSGDATRQVVESPEFDPLRLKHVWHEDRGWSKPVILNLSLAQVTSEYVIFCDGDCVVRSDFVESHCRHAKPRCFVSGTPIQIPRNAHERFHDKDIVGNRVFQFDFLTEYWDISPKLRRRLHPGRWEPLLNFATYRYCVFRGSNASAWLSDILAVNGFDETFSYGSDDREFGVRLRNAGVASRWLKYSLCQLHLCHPVSRNDAQLRGNRQRFRKLFFSGATRVEPGIDTAVERHQQRSSGEARLRPPQCTTSRNGSPPLPIARGSHCPSAESSGV